EVVPAPGVPALQHLAEGHAGVDAAAPDAGEQVLLGVAAGRNAGVAALISDEGEQVGGIGLVEDGEPGVEADGAPVAAQEAVGDGVEGAGPAGGGDPLAGGGLGPGRELGGRPAAEGEEQDLLRWHASVDQVGQPGGQGGRLAGSRARDDQQVPAVVAYGRPLIVGQGRGGG